MDIKRPVDGRLTNHNFGIWLNEINCKLSISIKGWYVGVVLLCIIHGSFPPPFLLLCSRKICTRFCLFVTRTLLSICPFLGWSTLCKPAKHIVQHPNLNQSSPLRTKLSHVCLSPEMLVTMKAINGLWICEFEDFFRLDPTCKLHCKQGKDLILRQSFEHFHFFAQKG